MCNLHWCYTFCTDITLDLHRSHLSQSESGIFFIYYIKVSGIPSGKKLLKMIRYLHMRRYRWFHWYQVCLWCIIETSSGLPRKSSAIFWHLRKKKEYYTLQLKIMMQRTANENAACQRRICKRSDQPKIERLVNNDARLILRGKLNGATTR